MRVMCFAWDRSWLASHRAYSVAGIVAELFGWRPSLAIAGFGARGSANVTLLTEHAIGAGATIMALATAANMAAITIGTANAAGLVDYYGSVALGAFCGVAAITGGIIPRVSPRIIGPN